MPNTGRVVCLPTAYWLTESADNSDTIINIGPFHSSVHGCWTGQHVIATATLHYLLTGAAKKHRYNGNSWLWNSRFGNDMPVRCHRNKSQCSCYLCTHHQSKARDMQSSYIRFAFGCFIQCNKTWPRKRTTQVLKTVCAVNTAVVPRMKQLAELAFNETMSGEHKVNASVLFDYTSSSAVVLEYKWGRPIKYDTH